ncbi:hypothetical protein PPERSA_09553 [Pseudocohnilembus persalinus]|uniref:EF-hand domain-containing protein n=1 Tax=Pseudocohnilembus persalinus TaxID=266149 RepID=A0A0V0QFG1_PSEPJ|nr:hypothetical protein PPERSA_09553 [Pseudocohnilembus persalinus]|eukprot:KRX00947.1 hypothetical protein PPERSA_09553 [Pseudocohnilembus persalinus]
MHESVQSKNKKLQQESHSIMPSLQNIKRAKSAMNFKKQKNNIYTRMLAEQKVKASKQDKNLKDKMTFDEILTSEVDKDMAKYKYKNENYLKYLEKEKEYGFIFDKKKQNPLKYSSKSKINTTALPVPRGTVSIMLNVDKKDYGFNLENFKKKIPQKSKFKMKWKTIQWLLNNKKEAIRQLSSNKQLMLKYARAKKDGMNRQEFGELLSYVGLGADNNLADKLFYIFDNDNSLTVDYKELIIGLETFKKSDIEDKIQSFIEICDDEGNDCITQDQLYQVFKQNLFNYDDKVKLKEQVRLIFKEADLNGDKVLSKEELQKAVNENSILLGLLKESIKSIQRVDQIIENDLEEPFHSWKFEKKKNYKTALKGAINNNEENKNKQILTENYSDNDSIVDENN